MPEVDALRFTTRGAWRRWLARNHGRSRGVWLFIRKKGKVARGLRYDEAVEEALCFGWIDSRVRAHDEVYFVQWYSPRKDKSVWSQTNKRRVARLVEGGRMTPAGLERVEVAKRNGRWGARTGGGGSVRAPPDLTAALRADPSALRGWRSLPPSSRRTYVHWINDARRPETRGRRVRDVVDRSRRGVRAGML